VTRRRTRTAAESLRAGRVDSQLIIDTYYKDQLESPTCKIATPTIQRSVRNNLICPLYPFTPAGFNRPVRGKQVHTRLCPTYFRAPPIPEHDATGAIAIKITAPLLDQVRAGPLLILARVAVGAQRGLQPVQVRLGDLLRPEQRQRRLNFTG